MALSPPLPPAPPKALPAPRDAASDDLLREVLDAARGGAKGLR